jgi:hypothetical protein
MRTVPNETSGASAHTVQVPSPTLPLSLHGKNWFGSPTP